MSQMPDVRAWAKEHDLSQHWQCYPEVCEWRWLLDRAVEGDAWRERAEKLGAALREAHDVIARQLPRPLEHTQEEKDMMRSIRVLLAEPKPEGAG